MSTHPLEILSVRLHADEAAALAMETANFNLHAGLRRDFDVVRGGRLNGVEPRKHALRGWNPQWDTQPATPQ